MLVSTIPLLDVLWIVPPDPLFALPESPVTVRPPLAPVLFSTIPFVGPDAPVPAEVLWNLSPVEPTEAMTFTTYGITDFDVQYWNGGSWVTVPGGSVTGNNKVWQKFTFTPVWATGVRVQVNNALASYSRITEVEALGW